MTAKDTGGTPAPAWRTYYREEYERNAARVTSKEGRYLKSKRQSTVEPVFGTLTQFMGLRKINTIGIRQANKVMHLSAIAYNLKKYLKFDNKRVKSGAASLVFSFSPRTLLPKCIGAFLKSTSLVYFLPEEKTKPLKAA